MKINKLILLGVGAMMLLASCDHNVTTETTVYPDGRLDKMLVFENTDSTHNIVGLQRQEGWTKTVAIKEAPEDKSKSGKYITTFRKSFASADEANRDLAATSDSLLRITSTFEKNFRWFYTHIKYSETIHAVNNMQLKPDNFLVKEDFAFIDRLPAEGKPISKGDEFYLSELNNRIYDKYGMRAYFEEYYSLGRSLLQEQQLESKWLDTLDAHKEDLFRKLSSEEKDVKDNYLRDAIDSIGIPLDKARFTESFAPRNKLFEQRLNFISKASEGKYKHIVHLPWEVIESNADSVAGTTVAWAPPSIKFLLKDYTMYSECRKPNYAVWALSGVLVLFTGYLFIRRRSSAAAR